MMKPKYLLPESKKVFRSFQNAVSYALANGETAIHEWIGGKTTGYFADCAILDNGKFRLAYHLLGQLPCD